MIFDFCCLEIIRSNAILFDEWALGEILIQNETYAIRASVEFTTNKINEVNGTKARLSDYIKRYIAVAENEHN